MNNSKRCKQILQGSNHKSLKLVDDLFERLDYSEGEDFTQVCLHENYPLISEKIKIIGA